MKTFFTILYLFVIISTNDQPEGLNLTDIYKIR